MKNSTLIFFLFLSIASFSQKLSIDETLNYIENIENYYTEGRKNHLVFNRKSGILTKTEYVDGKIDQIKSVHISDLSNEIEYKNELITLRCSSKNCVEFIEYKVTVADYQRTGNKKQKYKSYINDISFLVIQEYNGRKVVTAIKYLFSLFNDLKIDRDSKDPFAQFMKSKKVNYENSNISIIQLKDENGGFQIPVKIGKISSYFVLDSGATDTTISSKLEAKLIENGIIKKDDYLSNALYRIADNSIISQRRFVLKNLTVGSFTVKDIIVSVGDKQSPLLLGKNFLDRFDSWAINNSNKTIELKVE